MNAPKSPITQTAAAKTATVTKTAVDEIAASYWESYFADSGYGKQWVRKIPMRVKAELAKLADIPADAHGVRTAALGDDLVIAPLTSIVSNERITVEGIARSLDPGRKVIAFVADFDNEGELLGFDIVDAT